MLLWREKLQHVPVMSLRTGGELGEANEPIIDPATLRIVAFYCSGRLITYNPAVLHTNDIREFGKMGFIVNDSEDIMPLNDLVRLQKIINLQFELIGKRVVDTASHKLGKVNNYIVESASFMITKLSVRQPLLKAINEPEILIDRRQIREINHDTIVVEAPTIKEKAASLKTLPMEFQNPFKHTPQPEHADTGSPKTLR